MTGRVSLLILMTWLFAAAWSSDQEPLQAKQPAKPARPYTEEPVHETVLRRWKLPSSETAAAAMQDQWAPTPQAVPAGTYLVVDRLGRSEKIVIVNSTAGNELLSQTEDHFIAEFHGERCHWIRLAEGVDTSLLPIAAEPVPSIQR